MRIVPKEGNEDLALASIRDPIPPYVEGGRPTVRQRAVGLGRRSNLREQCVNCACLHAWRCRRVAEQSRSAKHCAAHGPATLSSHSTTSARAVLSRRRCRSCRVELWFSGPHDSMPQAITTYTLRRSCRGPECKALQRCRCRSFRTFFRKIVTTCVTHVTSALPAVSTPAVSSPSMRHSDPLAVDTQ